MIKAVVSNGFIKNCISTASKKVQEKRTAALFNATAPFLLLWGVGRRAWEAARGLVHDTPQSLDLPFPLHQVAGYFGRAAGGNVKILFPGTKLQGLAGSGEQRVEAAGAQKNREPSWKVELR